MATKVTGPRWARHQIVAAYICGIVGVALFIVQAIADPLWHVRLDFGIVAGALCFIGAYVIFNLKLPGWWRAFAQAIKTENADQEGSE